MKPTIEYWHVYTDENGISKQVKSQLTQFDKQSMGGKSAEQWNNHIMQSAANILMVELPANWVGEWHENPKPQWIIPIKGRWFVETMDSQIVEMGPGDLSFGADQNTQDQKGHRSGSLDGKACQLMVVQLDEKWVAAMPGELEI